ncbi:hypothetical protein [Pseudomonas quasicaspiana]|uniref:hypothetical protein n=1 Tax=Pseudomonas quasicaspiana TaxID=2829821 RepID=UPI001E387164|nr:hypothetical protein [Pseudomonas quasicaspiana]MCD5977243.1 hypothetical protein [Pseudomonas quasicaspiana]
MSELKWKWLVFTVLFGMVPIFIRLLVAGFDTADRVPLFTASDFIALGIVLQVSLMNEVKYDDFNDVGWKQVMVGCSVLYMVVYAVLYVLTLVSEFDKAIDAKLILYVSIALSFVSLLLCWAVYDRLTISARSKRVA